MMYKNVLEMLEETASKYPEKTAVKDEFEEETFEKLVEKSKRIASALEGFFDKNAVIPVYMEKSVKTLETFFGIVYAGGAYSLLAPIQPKERCVAILKKIASPIMITDKNHLDVVKELDYDIRILLVEDLVEQNIDEEKIESIRKNSTDIDPLYVNFTSGSTGVPKGVVVGHRSTIEFIDQFVSIFDISESDIIGNQAPFDFDVSVKDIYSMMRTGATLYIIPRTSFLFPKKLLEVIEQEHITTLIWAVSALCLITSLKGFSYIIPSYLKKVMFSGEVMPVKHLMMWQKALPDVQYINLYGPTEITCNCTYYIISENVEETTVLPIGKAFPNEKVFLLDENNNLVTEKNIHGEICVAGSCLALGYYKEKNKTDEVFIQNPLNNQYNELVYRTGDLAYYSDNENLVYVGRKDFQIKHLGHRIEMGEIESNILKYPPVSRVCCLYDDKKQQIVAFYQGECDSKAIKDHLKDKLVKYMIPEKFYKVDEMPITANGKINRKLLRSII